MALRVNPDVIATSASTPQAAPAPRERNPHLGAFQDWSMDEITMLLDYLDDATKVAFAFTCRPLFNILIKRFPRLLPLASSAQQALIPLLEKDAPNLYCCGSGCVQLHYWGYEGWLRGQDGWFTVEGRCPLSLQSIFFFPNAIRLPYSLAHVIMNGHAYGPSHGPSPEVLNFTYKLKDEFGNIWPRKWEAKVIDNELVLASFVRVSQRTDDRMFTFIKSNIHNLCKHLKTERQLIVHRERWVGDKNSDHQECWEVDPRKGYRTTRFRKAAKTALERDVAVKACQVCMTDAYIKVLPRTGAYRRKQCKLEIATYHNLGSLTSPHEWKWHQAGDSRRMEDHRKAGDAGDASLCRPGIIREKWHDIDGDVPARWA
jgi:hypothetical protein